MTVKSLGRNTKGCWYHISEWECVLCGRTTIYRERRWTPKPKEWWDRHEEHEMACSGHFL